MTVSTLSWMAISSSVVPSDYCAGLGVSDFLSKTLQDEGKDFRSSWGVVYERRMTLEDIGVY